MNPKKIVACIKQSELSSYVTDYSTWVASQINRPLEFFHAKDSNIDHETLLESYYQQALKAGIPKANISINEKNGNFLDELNKYQAYINLLVIGRHNGDNNKNYDKEKRVIYELLRTIERPTLSVTQPFTVPKTTMVAFNGSESSKKLIALLAQSNLFKSIPIYLVMSGKENENRQEELAWAHQALEQAQYDVTSSFIVGGGNIEDTIIRTVEEQSIDLLIMGAFSHHSLYHMIFGSKTMDLLKYLQIPILHLR